jgi:hypothetical protein
MDPAQLYHLLNDPTFKEPENMRATIHVHGDKESNWELGEKLGLSAEAVQLFRFACLEVKVEQLAAIRTILNVAKQCLT